MIVTHCFDSLAIRLWSEDLKHLIPRPGLPGLQGEHGDQRLWPNRLLNYETVIVPCLLI